MSIGKYMASECTILQGKTVAHVIIEWELLTIIKIKMQGNSECLCGNVLAF